MPKRGKRPSRSEETELPGGVPPPAAPAAPGLSAPSAPSTRRKAEELMQRLWNGELAQSRETAKLPPPTDEKLVSVKGTLEGYSSTDCLPHGEAFFPVMSSAELAPLLVPVNQPEKVKSTFEEYGVCVVTNVLTGEECEVLEELWHDDLLQLLRGNKSQASEVPAVSKDLRAWPKHWDNHLGMKGTASKHGLAHGSFAWAARLHPKVRQVFADLYDAEQQELVVGLNPVFWSSAQDAGKDTNPEWLHVDQNHRTGVTWPCAQGVLYVWPSEGSSSSSTVVWPKSHTEVYERMMEDPLAMLRGRSLAGQTVKLKELNQPHLREELMSEALLNARRVPCPAGSLLLWDSRTVHQGWRGGPRLAQPICWEPRVRRSEEALKRKLWMCCSGVPSTHSAAEGRVHDMAKEAPSPSLEDGLPLLRACLVPYGIRSNQESTWAQQQQALWPSETPKQVAAALNDLSHTVLPMLRPELLQVL